VKPVIIHSQARAELDEAIAFYEQQLAGLGLDLQTVVERAIGRIQQNPQLGAPYKATEFRHYVVRRFPCIIFYAEREEGHLDCRGCTRAAQARLLGKAAD
jgi:toxin ParE1/3/4